MDRHVEAWDDAAYFTEWFDEIVRPMLGRLLHVSRRILGSDDLAWDAVQETLLSLWQLSDVPPNPGAWLLKTVTHRSLHQARTLRRRRKHEVQACAGRNEASDRDDPSDVVASSEDYNSLLRALSNLSERHRLTLSLLVIDGLDYEAISQALRIPVGTVRSRLNRSREALRELLRQDYPEVLNLDD